MTCFRKPLKILFNAQEINIDDDDGNESNEVQIIRNVVVVEFDCQKIDKVFVFTYH